MTKTFPSMVEIASLACILTLVPMAATAQGNDFGTNLSAEVHKRHSKKVTSIYSFEMRTRDDVSAIDRLSLRAQANYKLKPWLKASAGLSFLYDYNKRISLYDEDDKDVVRGKVEVGAPKNLREYWGVRLRGDLSLTASHEIGWVKVSLRERWQYTYRFRRLVIGRYNYLYKRGDETGHVFSAKGKNVLRSRIAAETKIPNSPINPFASVEAFNAWELEKMRYTVGANWKINRHHSLELYYRYQDVSFDDDYVPNRHIVGLAYLYHIK